MILSTAVAALAVLWFTAVALLFWYRKVREQHEAEDRLDRECFDIIEHQPGSEPPPIPSSFWEEMVDGTEIL